jgi:hypothetical protein
MWRHLVRGGHYATRGGGWGLSTYDHGMLEGGDGADD